MSPEQPISGESSPPQQPPADVPATAPAEQREAEPAIQPRIWVASLSDYNNGRLHGAWIDAAQEEADLQAEIDAMLAASPLTAETGEPAEEWAIHDADGFGPLPIDEHDSLHWISLVAKGIAEHGPAFAAWVAVLPNEEHAALFNEAYLGHFDDLHTYIEQRVNDLCYDRILDQVVPPSIRPYVKIDITATANDLLLHGDLEALPAPDGGVWIFNG